MATVFVRWSRERSLATPVPFEQGSPSPQSYYQAGKQTSAAHPDRTQQSEPRGVDGRLRGEGEQS